MRLLPPDARRDWLQSQDLIVDADQLASLSELDDADLQFAGLTTSKPYLVDGQCGNPVEETGIENIVKGGDAHP